MKIFCFLSILVKVDKEGEMSNVQVIYTLGVLPASMAPSIFLAGPTPRKSFIPSWRPRAIRLLRRYNQELVIYDPEPADATNWSPDSDDHINWERAALMRSRIILFWVDRHLAHMPGFRTNTEWGFWTAYDPGRLVLSYPKDAPGMRGMANDASFYNIPVAHSLSTGIRIAVELACSTRG
jgi:hypothetical protein